MTTNLADLFVARLRVLVDAAAAEVERIRVEVLPEMRRATRKRLEEDGVHEAEVLDDLVRRNPHVMQWAGSLTIHAEAREALDDDPALVDAYAATLAAEVEDLADALFPDDDHRAHVIDVLDVSGWPLTARPDGVGGWANTFIQLAGSDARFGSFPDLFPVAVPDDRIRELLSSRYSGERLDERCAEVRAYLDRTVTDGPLPVTYLLSRLRALLGRWHEGERLDKLCADVDGALTWAVIVQPRDENAIVWPHESRPFLRAGESISPPRAHQKGGFYNVSVDTLPADDTRPWWPVAGLASLLRAELRIRPELDAWLALRHERDRPSPGGVAYAAARSVADGEAVDRIAGKVHRRLPALLKAVWPDGEPPIGDATCKAKREDLLRADAAAAAYLEGIDTSAKTEAARLRRSSETRWQAFCAATNDREPSPDDLCGLWRPWIVRLAFEPSPDETDDLGRVTGQSRVDILFALARVVRKAFDIGSEPGFFAVSAARESRATAQALLAGGGYGRHRTMASRDAYPWKGAEVTPLESGGAHVELLWDGRPTPGGVQLLFDFPEFQELDWVTLRGILDELATDGMRDWLALHSIAAEQGRSGGMDWTWEEHRARTRYDAQIRKGRMGDKEAAAAVSARLMRLKRGEIWLKRKTADGWTFSRVGPHGLLDIPELETDHDVRQMRRCRVEINPEIYRGARRGGGRDHFILVPEKLLTLGDDLLPLATMLVFDFLDARNQAGRVRLEARNLWARAGVRQGYQTKRSRWPDATKTLDRKLEQLIKCGFLGDFEPDDQEISARTVYTLMAGTLLETAQSPPTFGPSAAGLPRDGSELKRWRESRGWSQRDLAGRLGVGQATISRAETAGGSKNLSARMLTALRKARADG